jgi:hypothetical protein
MRNLAGRGVRENLCVRIAALQPDSRRLWGRMSAHQMICHLNDSFRVCAGEKPVSPATGVIQRTAMKWIALYFPAPWPKNIPTRPEVDQEAGGTPPIDFTIDRETLLGFIKRFSNENGELRDYAHPFFGRMRDREWLRWAYLHVDHHLRQFGV